MKISPPVELVAERMMKWVKVGGFIFFRVLFSSSLVTLSGQTTQPTTVNPDIIQRFSKNAIQVMVMGIPLNSLLLAASALGLGSDVNSFSNSVVDQQTYSIQLHVCSLDDGSARGGGGISGSVPASGAVELLKAVLETS